MVRSLTLIFSGAFFIAAAHAGLQLTPKASEYFADGAKFTHLEFYDDGKIATYEPPRGWAYSGNPAQLTLRPPNKAQAEITITRVPLSQPGSFDEESLKKLVSEAVALVPKGSESISVVSQKKNPFLRNKETFSITLSYTFYGQKYGRSILFLNRATDQIRFQLVSRMADFKDLQRTFQGSLSTWQNL